MTEKLTSPATRRALLQSAPLIGLTLTAAPALAAEPLSGRPVESDRKAWWKAPYRIVQTNLREPDVRHDPKKIAREIREFGATALVSNIGGIVAFYPTELALHWRNPFLKGDFVGEMVQAAHDEGLAFIGRFDMSKAMKPAYDAHPDWFMVNRDGGPRIFAGTYQACPNGGWIGDYAYQILREALPRYEVDGLFFNMGGFPLTDYAGVAHGACVCGNCRTRFREMYGRDLPQKDGFTDPAWSDYLDFQRRVTTDLAAKSNALIKELRPAAAIMGYGEVGRHESQRRISRAAPEWAYLSGELGRHHQATRPGKPFSATSAAHMDYPWRQVLESAACHRLRFAQQLATGAQLDLYLMGTFSDQDDQRFVKPMAELFAWHAANASHYHGLEPAPQVAIWQSDENSMFAGATPNGRLAGACFKGAYSALLDARIPFRLASGERVADGTVKLAPQENHAILLPHVAIMSDAEAAVLDAYVQAGGLVISTGETGAYGPRGVRRQAMAMKSSPILAFAGQQEARGFTFDGAKNAFGITAARIPADGPYFTVALRPDALNLLPAAPEQRYGPPEFSYALPGDKGSGRPGMLVRKHGAGHAVHIPWLADWQYYRDGLEDLRAMFSGVIARYAHPPAVKLTGRGPVEVTVQRQPATGRLLVHLVNYAGQRNTSYEDPPEIGGLALGIRGKAAIKAEAIVAGKSLQARGIADKDGYTWFDLPPVAAFEAVSVAVSS